MHGKERLDNNNAVVATSDRVTLLKQYTFFIRELCMLVTGQL